MMLASILTMEARTRCNVNVDVDVKLSRVFEFSLLVNGIRVVKPDKADMVEAMLLQMFRRGQLRGKVMAF